MHSFLRFVKAKPLGETTKQKSECYSDLNVILKLEIGTLT
jgi:hypothetical protein